MYYFKVFTEIITIISILTIFINLIISNKFLQIERCFLNLEIKYAKSKTVCLLEFAEMCKPILS